MNFERNVAPLLEDLQYQSGKALMILIKIQVSEFQIHTKEHEQTYICVKSS